MIVRLSGFRRSAGADDLVSNHACARREMFPSPSVNSPQSLPRCHAFACETMSVSLGIQFALFRGQHERKQRGHDVA